MIDSIRYQILSKLALMRQFFQFLPDLVSGKMIIFFIVPSLNIKASMMLRRLL